MGESQLFAHELAAEWARRTPDAPAVLFQDLSVTHGELEKEAERWTDALRESGVRVGDVVGVCLDRSPSMIACVIGVLRAGATYLPLDPSYPAERLDYMMADSGVTVVATEDTQSALLSRLRRGFRPVVAGAAADATITPVKPTQPAFLIYTSGSTGRPKGVAVSHRAMANFVTGMAERLGITAADVILGQAPLSFDISVFEIFIPLSVGASIRLVDRATATDGPALAAAIGGGGVSVVQGTATTHRMLLAAGWRGGPAYTVVSGGEPLPPDVSETLQNTGTRVWNNYGPTETTVYTHALRMTEGRRVTLGGDLPNVRTYLLDENLDPVPPGEPGEIFLAGDCLANGYPNRPALTADRFLPDPFGPVPGERMYRSGDLARWTEDGRLESLGRADQQVKLRGYRIELGEIEALLRGHARITDAVVVLRDGEAEQFLAAYLTLAGDPEPSRGEIRALLGQSLPSHMIPAQYVVVDALPTTPSGKVDRAAVTALPVGRHLDDGAAVAPRSAVEEVVAAVWLDLLDLDELSVVEPVIDLGASSLTAMRAADVLGEIFATTVPVRMLFDRPTVADQAGYLAERCEDAGHRADMVLELAAVGGN